MNNRKFSYILLILVIVATAIAGTVVLVVNENSTKGFVRIDAEVIGYKEKLGDLDDLGRREKMYSETVRYVVDGVTYTAQNNVWTNSPKSVGKTIEIAYDPNSPQNCVFIKSLNTFSLVLYIISIISLIALVLQIVMNRKRRLQ